MSPSGARVSRQPCSVTSNESSLTLIKRTLAPALLALTVAACAGTPKPAALPTPQAPVATEATSPIAPPAAAERAAAHLQPTGLELGTMWTFESPPLDYWAKEYNFRPTQAWLDHVRLSSVRFADYCSASFVSPDGLVMTNHHCGRECEEAQSTPQRDYVTMGFYAATRAEEKVCPNVYLDQLVSIEDVTQQVQSAVPAGGGDSATTAAVRAATQRMEQQCSSTTKLHCQVVSLYHGGLYHLYRYNRISPVKLVFAPELAAGFFGGDPDNFTYPRYDLDMTFVRAYEPDGVTPLRPKDYFRWKAEGAAIDEPVFVTGNPGTTSRLITVAQMMYERNFRHPFYIGYLRSQYEMLQEQAKQGPEAAQRVRQDMFEVSNSLKAYEGEERGLLDTLIVGRKIAWERDFRNRINANPQLRTQYGDVFDRLQAIAAEKMAIAPRLNASNTGLFPDPLQLAGALARVIRERDTPAARRSPGLRGDTLEQMAARLRQPIPFDAAAGSAMLARRLRFLQAILPSNDPLLTQLMKPGETPA
ncbi:MAG TPA: S46 family peptidase, partial [Longimicrobiales bacterium]